LRRLSASTIGSSCNGNWRSRNLCANTEPKLDTIRRRLVIQMNYHSSPRPAALNYHSSPRPPALRINLNTCSPPIASHTHGYPLPRQTPRLLCPLRRCPCRACGIIPGKRSNLSSSYEHAGWYYCYVLATICNRNVHKMAIVLFVICIHKHPIIKLILNTSSVDVLFYVLLS